MQLFLPSSWWICKCPPWTKLRSTSCGKLAKAAAGYSKLPILFALIPLVDGSSCCCVEFDVWICCLCWSCSWCRTMSIEFGVTWMLLLPPHVLGILPIGPGDSMPDDSSPDSPEDIGDRSSYERITVNNFILFNDNLLQFFLQKNWWMKWWKPSVNESIKDRKNEQKLKKKNTSRKRWWYTIRFRI